MATGIKKQEYDFKGVTITDANNAPYGISSITYSNTNAPFSGKHATIITTANEGGEWKQQIAVPWYGTDEMAIRKRDNQANWSNWQTIKFGDTNWNDISLANDVTAVGARYRVIGNTVYIKLNDVKFSNGIPAVGSATLGSIPSAYAPSTWTTVPVIIGNADIGKLGINNSGTMTLYTNVAVTSSTIVGGLTFYLLG